MDALQSAAAASVEWVENDFAAESPPAAPVSPAEPEKIIQWPALPGVPDTPIPPMPLEVTAASRPEYQAGADPALDSHAVPQASPRLPDAPCVPATFKAPVAEPEPLAEDGMPTPKPRRRIWAFAAGVAVLVLAAQVVYAYRSELVAHFPVVQPALAQVCEWAGCSVPPLQQPAALNIEASDLQVVDKAQPNVVQLTATLRNRATVALGYPAFDLVLTDNREHALARRVIVPKDYLPGSPAQAAQSTIAANAEIAVRVDMDIGGLPAAGFRLNLTPAPGY